MTHPHALAVKLIVPCVIFLSAGCTFAPGADEEYAQSFALSGRAEVHVHVANARVHVTTSEDPKVDFHVRYESDGSDPGHPFTTHQDGNVVELTQNEDSRDWWNGNRSGVDRAVIEVRMPRNADLQLRTSNGAITVAALKGKLKASSSNGFISVEDLDGDCDLSTSNGRIRASGRFDSLDIHSSNGAVVARAANGSTVASRWSIGTSNAGIDLSLPTDLKADLSVATSNGGMQLELPLTVQGVQDQYHLRGSLNGGGQEVSVHTSNGHIRVSGA